MKSWYDRYGVWIALALFVSVSAISLIGFDPTYRVVQSICAANDKGDCLRQWLEATSGWFGGAVTLATLVFLARQVSDIRTHHRETLMYSTRPTYLRAKRVKDAAKSVRITQNLLAGAMTESDESGVSPKSFQKIMAAVRYLEEQFSRKEFDDFETDIGYVGVGSAFSVRSMLRTLNEMGDYMADAAANHPNREFDAVHITTFKKFVDEQMVESYLESLCTEADRYIDHWESTIRVTSSRA